MIESDALNNIGVNLQKSKINTASRYASHLSSSCLSLEYQQRTVSWLVSIALLQ